MGRDLNHLVQMFDTCDRVGLGKNIALDLLVIIFERRILGSHVCNNTQAFAVRANKGVKNADL